MTKIKMDFQDYSVCKPSAEWFEASCNLWADHYNFMLGISWNSDADNAWYKEQICINKLYDV
jgi:hypothetical protein